MSISRHEALKAAQQGLAADARVRAARPRASEAQGVGQQRPALRAVKIVDSSPPRKLLILDLDETLLFATENRLELPESFTIGPYHVYVRPYLPEFIATCFTHFDLAIWTASSEDYAAAVVAQLFESVDRLKFVWSRRRCTTRIDLDTREMYHVKDLKKVRVLGYSLEHVIVVDDTARKHERNYGNLVTIQPFEGDPSDDELLHLAAYLPTLAAVENVRTLEKRG